MLASGSKLESRLCHYCWECYLRNGDDNRIHPIGEK